MVDIPLNAKLKWGRIRRKTFINMIELRTPEEVENVDPARLYLMRYFKVKSASGLYLIGDIKKARFLRPRFVEC